MNFCGLVIMETKQELTIRGWNGRMVFIEDSCGPINVQYNDFNPCGVSSKSTMRADSSFNQHINQLTIKSADWLTKKGLGRTADWNSARVNEHFRQYDLSYRILRTFPAFSFNFLVPGNY